MKVVTEKKVKVIEEVSGVRFEDIRIGKIKDDITITMENQVHESGSRLNVTFSCQESRIYFMSISEEGIRFERLVKGPKPGNRGMEYLCVKVHDKRPGPGKKGELAWRKELPHESDGWDFYYVPFEPRKVGYW